MEGTRLRILQLLQKNSNDTVEGLAKAIGLAPATIRRHLDILQRDRLVTFEEVRKRTGRPEYSFHLTEDGHEALPKGYDELLGMMVQELSTLTSREAGGMDGQQILELLFLRLSRNVVRTYEDELADSDLRERLATLTRHLSEKDFFPEVEYVGGNLRIKLLNCPFRSVALQNKAVCTFDLNLISSLLELDVERAECIHDGDGICVYTAPVDAINTQDLLSLNTA